MMCRDHILSLSELTILAHVLGLFMHTSPSLSSVCPDNFNTVVASVCLINRSDTNGFCLACNSCAEYGKQRDQLVYLIGRNAPLLTFVMGDSKPVYTGLNCLLEPVTDNGPVWRDLDPNRPEYSTSGARLIWPDVRTPECKPFLLWQPRELIMNEFTDDDRSQSFQVYCEYGGPIPSGRRAVRFRDDFPVRLPTLVQQTDSFVGCPAPVTARTRTDCAFKCALDSTCRSVYFENTQSRCIHIKHADSLLPKGIAEGGIGWSRFAKVSTTTFLSDET